MRLPTAATARSATLRRPDLTVVTVERSDGTIVLPSFDQDGGAKKEMAKARPAEVEELRAELEASRPFLALARELQAEVDRIAADPDADLDALTEVFDRLPKAARQRLAEATFQSLPPERQWAVLERLFDDHDLRAALEGERARWSTRGAVAGRRANLVERFVERGLLDTRCVAADERLTLGLFREVDVESALRRGQASSTVARRLVVRATAERGMFEVVDDVFNPARGMFVTAEYDEGTWRAERLAPHALVRLGAIHVDGGTEYLAPEIAPGGRVDVEVAGHLRPGHLHAGYALIGEDDLFHRGHAVTPVATGRHPAPDHT
jgi:hypothetical protein